MTPPLVVFDAVVFVQALISDHGPAAACVDAVRAGKAMLFLSDPILAEIREVPLRPELTKRYSQLTPERVGAFVGEIVSLSVHMADPPKAISLPRDPKDEPYTDLAVHVGAAYLVTWNQSHLTYLMAGDTPEGRTFCTRFPQVTILSPPQFLKKLRERQSPQPSPSS